MINSVKKKFSFVLSDPGMIKLIISSEIKDQQPWSNLSGSRPICWQRLSGHSRDNKLMFYSDLLYCSSNSKCWPLNKSGCAFVCHCQRRFCIRKFVLNNFSSFWPFLTYQSIGTLHEEFIVVTFSDFFQFLACKNQVVQSLYTNFNKTHFSQSDDFHG